MENTDLDMEKNIDILSFDGGGSRGIMELCILDDVMRLATIVLKRPQCVDYLLKNEEDGINKNVLENRDIRKRLSDDLKKVTDPIHPTDVYEMIVGTSTGALIAFGLVGGKEIKKKKDERPERVPMSVKECIDMYLEQTEKIFTKSWAHWFVSQIPGFSSIPATTYSQENVREVLHDKFGDSILEDFSGSKCVAGAVARKLGDEEELVLFDTKSEDYRFYKTYQVLLATSNAPVYFDTPVSIGMNDFVDGGVGGNCPLAQAIPRAKELFGEDGKDAEITSALSIAPPNSSRTEVPHRFQIKYWLNYFVNESTDGNAVFRDVVKRNRRKKTLFQRLSPRGEELKVFKLDEINAQKMVDAMEREKRENHMFLIDVIATAMQVVFTSINKPPKNVNKNVLIIAAQLAETAGNAYYSSQEYEHAIISYKTSIRLRKKFTIDDSSISKMNHGIAKCLINQGKYQLALNLLNLNMQFLINHYDANNAELLVDTVIDLADCYIATFCYDDAEVFLKAFLEKQILPMEKLVRALSSLAWCKQQQGKLDEAVIQYREANRYAPEIDDRDKAEVMNNLGVCLGRLGMNDKALRFIKDALEMRQRLITNNNVYLVAESHNNLGVFLTKTGDYINAENHLRIAHDMCKRIEGNRLISTVLTNLARCLALNNNHNHALDFAQQALQRMRKHVGDSLNLGIAKVRTVIGLCLFKDGKLDQAEDHLLASLRMTKKLFISENHPNLLEVCQILFDLYTNKASPDAQLYETKVKRINDNIQEMAKNID